MSDDQVPCPPEKVYDLSSKPGHDHPPIIQPTLAASLIGIGAALATWGTLLLLKANGQFTLAASLIGIGAALAISGIILLRKVKRSQ